MGKINVLPEIVANQIAAGEVVGRPASVVKELMENAVDAGSTSITVNYRDGGRELIQVIDNGCGMSREDARLAFERHATSKIGGVDDLYRLSSFGFRGEAVPSIASVAQVELKTRPCGSELGTGITVHGGQFVEERAENVAQGTRFLVKNLFYNTPARRRFLKDASVEGRHIVAEFQKIALSNPHISFSLFNRDVQEYELPAANLRQRITSVISRSNRNISGNLLEITADTSLITLEGFVGRPAAAKKNNREQYFFVNGRYFRSPYFHKAVMQAYSKLIPQDVQPSYFIYFTVNPEKIDVNVHPQKTEIKFDDEQALWQIVNAAVRESLGKTGVVPMMDFEIDGNMEIPVFRPGRSFKEPAIAANPDFNPFAYNLPDREDSPAVGDNASLSGMGESIYASSGFGDFNEFDSSVLDFIDGGNGIEEQGCFDIDGDRAFFSGAISMGGRIATIFCGSLTVVDAARARERILYERYIRMMGNNNSVSQQLLFPETLEFSDEDYAIFEQLAGELDSMGFDFKAQGGNKVGFTGLPSDLEASRLDAAMHELFEEVRESGHIDRSVRSEKTASVMARQGALGKAKNITDTEALLVLEQLAGCENYNYTPSGKPVMAMLTDEEISKRLQK